MANAKSTRARKGRSVTPSPESRREPPVSDQALKRRLSKREPVKISAAGVDAIAAHRGCAPDRDTTTDVDKLLSDAWSLFDCALTCLDELSQAQDPEIPPACQVADVAVVVGLGIERLARAKAALDVEGSHSVIRRSHRS